MTSLSSPLPSPVRRLPPLPGPRADGLTPGQRRVAVGVIVAAHAAGVWGLLQVGEVREAAREAMPMFFDLIAPPAPPAAPVPPAPPAPAPTPQPVLRKRTLSPPPPAPLVAAAPSPAPAAFATPAPAPAAEPPAPAPSAEPAPAFAAAPAPPPPAASAPAPRTIPPSAVQYLVEPAPEYPRASVRSRETGRVVVRVFIGEDGSPSQARVERSSGFPRLDDSAVAAVSKSRFRPPTIDGRPVSGWTLSPVDFSLEK